MIVACVLIIVFCVIVYNLVRIKLQDWLDVERMSRLGEKKLGTPSEECSSDNVNTYATANVTEDDSDDSERAFAFKHKPTVRRKRMQEPKSRPVGPQKQFERNEVDYSKLQLTEENVYNVSTDSLQSNEECEKPTFNFPSVSNFATTLFNWGGKMNAQNKESNSVIDLTDDSDSSRNTNNMYEVVESVVGKKNKRRKRNRNKNPIPARVLQNEPEREPPPPDVHSVEYTRKYKAPEVTVQSELTISGIKVKLPVNPYPSQKAVMGKIIQGCTKEQHALLESPTGSGKTLALLCGALAWQDHFSAEIEKNRQKQLFGELSDDENIDFKCEDLDDCDDKEQAKIPTVPKIYYGTRTHRQIEQVVRELNKTIYRHKKMTILSSREHTCIRTEERNKTELCNELLDPNMNKCCKYYVEANKKTIGTFAALNNFGLSGAWDIEELNQLGRELKACPYFAARSLMMEADIIFCPYNYLIDPDIRESMQINLKNQVIILDEAHNIEDICREAASVDLREDSIMDLIKECQILSKDKYTDGRTYMILKEYCEALVKFLNIIEVQEYDAKSESASSNYWTGAELTELLNINKIGVSKFPTVLAAGQSAISDYQQAKELKRDDKRRFIMSQVVKRTLEQIMFSLRMMESKQHVDDYRACITETSAKAHRSWMKNNTWYSAERQDSRVRTLKLLCMNPAVIFAPLAASARSIILSSGTLSPTTSFQSELGTEFPHMLNANHVIQKDQIYASCIGKGPTGVPLRATYKNVNQFNFQDELGRVVIDVCSSVPHGVLVFFSSYNMMNTQIERWRLRGTWDHLQSRKHIFLEPRYGGDLLQVMKEYRDVIADTESSQNGEINGALLLAVFRGKVAEGIDFSDNEARCVITVGIPYGVASDPIIKMKMEYNRKNIARGLLNDSEWYTIQAFRALNQALGRCIRHKNDWGAVLMVDERLVQPDYQKNLPKWIRSSLIRTNQYNLTEDLKQFVTKLSKRHVATQRENYIEEYD